MNTEYKKLLDELLTITIEENASDLHISIERFPTLRIDGVLVPLTRKKILTADDCRGLAMALMLEEQQKQFLEIKEYDFSYEFNGKARFRVNAYFQRGFVSVAMRFIPPIIRTAEDLNLPPILHEFTRPSQGFVLIVGPSGHGKSTTLAAIIDEINRSRADHIITIEDPIEYVFQQDRAIIDQREVFRDTASFSSALRAAFRQDPDVIMVGEMRDLETISTAITAAETGHLVFGTLHTNNAAQTIHRILDIFPPQQQTQIRSQLAATLLGIVSQRLIPKIGGGLIPACEILLANSAVGNLIRENKIHEIDLVIETSQEAGMISLNRALADLVKRQLISLENSLIYSLNPNELRTLLRR